MRDATRARKRTAGTVLSTALNVAAPSGFPEEANSKEKIEAPPRCASSHQHHSQHVPITQYDTHLVRRPQQRVPMRLLEVHVGHVREGMIGACEGGYDRGVAGYHEGVNRYCTMHIHLQISEGGFSEGVLSGCRSSG